MATLNVTSAQITQVTQLYAALFGRAPDSTGLGFWVNDMSTGNKSIADIANEMYKLDVVRTIYPLYLTNEQIIGAFYTNVLGRTADAGGLAYWTGVLNANQDIGKTIAALINNVANYTGTDPAGLASQTLFNNKVAVGEYFATVIRSDDVNLATQAFADLTAGKTVAEVEAGLAGAADAGSTFALTTDLDILVGTTKNDTFVGTNSTFAAGDSVNGGAGTDTLSLTVGGNITGGDVTNVETVSIRATAVASVDASGWVGVSTVTDNKSTGNLTVSNLANNAKLSLVGSSGDFTVTHAAAVTAGTADTVSVSLNGVTAGTITTSGFETIALSTTGAASTIARVVDASATKLTVTGDKDLTMTVGLAGTIVNVDASAQTGALSVITGNTVAGSATAAGLTVATGTGADTVDIRASEAADYTSVNTGAGNDTVVVLNSQITADATDTLNGSTGTDTLKIDFANTTATQATDLSATVTGFEVIEVVSNNTAAQVETLAMGANKLGISQFVWSGDAADSLAITGAAANSTVTVKTNANAVSAAIGTDTTTDTLNVVLDGTTVTTLTATNYETVNITSNKDSAGNTNALTTGALASATKVTLAGAGALTGGTITTAAAATFDASAYTGDLTATTFGASIKSYLGGSGKDEISLVAGDLKQGNSFAGGAGTDKLTVTATADQDAGILGLTGFETVNLATNATAADLFKADFRNVTDLASLVLTSGDDTDNLTLNRLSADTTLNFADTFANVTTTLNSGTTQKVGFTAAGTVTSLTLDSGTTSLTVTSDDGDATADEAMGVFTSISGTSLASITVNGADRTNLGTLASTVTKVDASAATGGLTVTASATATSIIGSQAADAITGGAGNDTIQGGKGADVLSGGVGSDTYVFEATGANNGADTITLVAGAGGDVLNFKNFISGGSVDQNGGAGTAITAYTAANVNDVNITNKVAVYADATDANINTATLVAALIQGAGDAFSLTAGGKTILVTGDPTNVAVNNARVWFVDDSLDGVSGTVSATDVVLVGTTSGAIDVDTLITSNFSFL